MKKLFSFLLVIITVSILGVWLFGNSRKTVAPSSVRESMTNTASTSSNNISVRPVLKSETNSLDKADANSLASKYKDYLAGKINKIEMMQAVITEKNMQNQDFYGKVVDQYGNPVVGAIVKGNVMKDSLETSKEETHTTQTDSDGLFQFTGLHGLSLGMAPSKAGYEWGARNEGYQASVGGKSSPTDRAILTMWKLRGAEPIRYVSCESRIASDGTPTKFDLATGKENPNGELQVTLLRSPLQVRRSGQKFDWEIKIEILHGGIVTENDPYPYLAPEGGYQPSFQFNMSSNNVPWDSTITQNFYIKNSQGQFGRMQLEVYSSVTPAGIKFDLWINPSGSQNLEFDPAKQVL
jgi:hypothetical protein